MMSAPFDNVACLDAMVQAKSYKRPKTILDHPQTKGPAAIADADDYDRQRREILSREDTFAFDYRCKANATDLEKRVNQIVQNLRRRDQAVYDSAEPRRGYGGQLHSRFPGDHFLSNRKLISETAIFDVARHMPKGAHLHIHFNACLLPHVLLDIAKDMDCMFITSDIPLIPDHHYVNYEKCEIQFSILPPERRKPGDLFSPQYEARQTMGFRRFRREFPRHYKKPVDDWLLGKLVFHEEETYGCNQTAHG